MGTGRNTSWQFETFIDDFRDVPPLKTRTTTTTTTTTSAGMASPAAAASRRTDSRILLVETNSPQSVTPTTSPNASQHKVERFTLQEVTSPTYYGAASLSYRSSVASTVSSVSTRSSLSHPTSYSPPISPINENKKEDTCSSNNRRPSYTAAMAIHSRPADPFPPLMIGSQQPLGWLRPSITPSATLDIGKSGNPSHFVLLGFGDAQVIVDLLGLKGPIPLDADNISERSFLFKVDDDQQAMCTLATVPSDGEEYPYLENLTLNRVGVTSILVALSGHSTVDDIMKLLGQVNKTLKGLDPQGTWWQRLILLFHHTTTGKDYVDQRFELVRNTLPNLMQHLPILPCVTVFASHIMELPLSYQRECRQLLYQQTCMHQIDHGWWHGSTCLTEDTSGSSDEEDEGFPFPVAVMIGNTKKKSAVRRFIIEDANQVASSSSGPSSSSSSSSSSASASMVPVAETAEYPFLANAAIQQDTSPAVELKHRFSKKWAEPPRRHHTVDRSSLSSSVNH